MNVSEAVAGRISTRAFLADPLPEAEIRDWLTAAQRAPSGGNIQPWRTIIVTGQARADVISDIGSVLESFPEGQATDHPIYPSDLWPPYETRRRRVGIMLYETLGIQRGDLAGRRTWFQRNFEFFDAPVGLFLILDERMGHGQWGHAGMYLQTLALLAEERGWGTCLQECWGMVRPALKTHLALDPGEMVWCGMAIGKPDPSHPVNTLRAERANLEDVAELRGFP